MTQSRSLTNSPVAGLQTSAYAALKCISSHSASHPICGDKELGSKLFKAVVRLEGNHPQLQTESAFPIVTLASAFASSATFL